MSQLAALDLTKVFLGSLILAFIYYILIYDDGSRLTQSIKNQKEMLSQAEIELVKLQKANQKAIELESIRLTQEKDFEKFNKVMPVTFNSIQLLKLLSREARSAGLEIVRISDTGNSSRAQTNNKSKPKRELDSFEVSFNFKGSYSQFMSFLSYVSRVNRVMLLKSFTITNTTSSTSNSDPSVDKIINLNGKFESFTLLNSGKIEGI